MAKNGKTQTPRELYPDSKSWNLWLNDLDTKSESTRYIYLRYFLKFLERWDTDPERLYQARLEHEASKDPRDRKIIEGWVKTQTKEILDEGLSAATARQLGKSVISFFDSQNMTFFLRTRDKPKVYNNGQRVILKDQIRKIWDRVGDEHRLRNRAMITFLKDSGLRISDMGNLDISDFTGARNVINEAGETFKAFEPIRVVKTKTIAYVHIGPEAIKDIDTYLEEERTGYSEDDPLFIDRTGNRIKTVNTSTIIYKLAKKLKNSNRISAHSLRKHFQVAFESSGVAKNWIGKYQGRIVGDSSRAYSQPEDVEGTLTKAYIDAYDSLRIFGGQVSTQQLDEQAQRIADLETQLEAERRNKIEESITVRNLEEKLKSIEPALELVMKFIEKERGVDRTREAE